MKVSSHVAGFAVEADEELRMVSVLTMVSSPPPMRTVKLLRLLEPVPEARVRESSPVLAPTNTSALRVTRVATSAPVVPTREVEPLEPETVVKAKVLGGRDLA